MGDELYRKLQKHIDSMPAGYPETGSGAEIKMLKKFYTENQAEIALKIGPFPETAGDIAKRVELEMTQDEIIEEIEKMSKEGSLFRVATPKGNLYRHPNFIMGLYEWHVNSVDREVAELADDIYDGLFKHHWEKRETKQLRVVPVDTAVMDKSSVQSYDKIRDLVKGDGNGSYAVAPCICRVEQTKLGNEVERPMETCLVFGLVADYYVENKIGRRINADELMEKLDECERAALVPFGTNSKDIVNMCMCDSESCQLFRNLRKFPEPASEVHAAFFAEIDSEKCIGCGKCAKRCQIDAVFKTDTLAGKKNYVHKIDKDRCIGCGLCVSTCKKEAVRMEEKEELPIVPENAMEMNIKIAEERAGLNL